MEPRRLSNTLEIEEVKTEPGRITIVYASTLPATNLRNMLILKRDQQLRLDGFIDEVAEDWVDKRLEEVFGDDFREE